MKTFTRHPSWKLLISWNSPGHGKHLENKDILGFGLAPSKWIITIETIEAILSIFVTLWCVCHTVWVSYVIWLSQGLLMELIDMRKWNGVVFDNIQVSWRDLKRISCCWLRRHQYGIVGIVPLYVWQQHQYSMVATSHWVQVIWISCLRICQRPPGSNFLVQIISDANWNTFLSMILVKRADP